MNGVSEVLKSSRIRPVVLKTDSEATVETGIARISRANWDNTGNLEELTFHHARMSNLLSSGSVSSERYFSSSDLLQPLPEPLSFNFLAITDFSLPPWVGLESWASSGCAAALGGAYRFAYSSNNC